MVSASFHLPACISDGPQENIDPNGGRFYLSTDHQVIRIIAGDEVRKCKTVCASSEWVLCAQVAELHLDEPEPNGLRDFPKHDALSHSQSLSPQSCC